MYSDKDHQAFTSQSKKQTSPAPPLWICHSEVHFRGEVGEVQGYVTAAVERIATKSCSAM